MKSAQFSWPLYDLIEKCFLTAAVTPPSLAALSLCDIADEDAAIDLFNRIIKLALHDDKSEPVARAHAIAECIRSILQAVQAHRNAPFVDRRRATASVKKLRNARLDDRSRLLGDMLKNPDLNQEILALILRAARSFGAVEDHKDKRGWKIRVVDSTRRGRWLRGEYEWVFELFKHPALFERVADIILKPGPSRHRSANLVRRLLSVANNPTCTKFCKLLKDERTADHDGLEILESALSYAARRTLFQGKDLPGDWLAQIKADSASIQTVARGAHQLLVRGLPGQGHPGDPRLDRYAAKIAEAFHSLTGRAISYVPPSDTAKSSLRRRRHGAGLCFMKLALRMINGSATAAQAQGQIDKIRGW